ncbi:MAG: hypothetical protein Q8Q33_10390, partial [Chlamydiota bacterium]|nr:hypothetical protein [Chlamydiota bacterium]
MAIGGSSITGDPIILPDWSDPNNAQWIFDIFTAHAGAGGDMAHAKDIAKLILRELREAMNDNAKRDAIMAHIPQSSLKGLKQNYSSITTTLKTYLYDSQQRRIGYTEVIRTSDSKMINTNIHKLILDQGTGKTNVEILLSSERGMATDLEALRQVMQQAGLLTDTLNVDSLWADWLDSELTDSDAKKKIIFEMIKMGLITGDGTGNIETWENVVLETWAPQVNKEKLLQLEMYKMFQVLEYRDQLVIREMIKAFIGGYSDADFSNKVKLSEALAKLKKNMDEKISQYGTLENFMKSSAVLKEIAHELPKSHDKNTATVKQFIYSSSLELVAISKFSFDDVDTLKIKRDISFYKYNDFGQLSVEIKIDLERNIEIPEFESFLQDLQQRIGSMNAEDFWQWVRTNFWYEKAGENETVQDNWVSWQFFQFLKEYFNAEISYTWPPNEQGIVYIHTDLEKFIKDNFQRVKVAFLNYVSKEENYKKFMTMDNSEVEFKNISKKNTKLNLETRTIKYNGFGVLGQVESTYLIKKTNADDVEEHEFKKMEYNKLGQLAKVRMRLYKKALTKEDSQLVLVSDNDRGVLIFLRGLSDDNLMALFLLAGLTATEVSRIKELWDKEKKCTLTSAERAELESLVNQLMNGLESNTDYTAFNNWLGDMLGTESSGGISQELRMGADRVRSIIKFLGGSVPHELYDDLYLRSMLKGGYYWSGSPDSQQYHSSEMLLQQIYQGIMQNISSIIKEEFNKGAKQENSEDTDTWIDTVTTNTYDGSGRMSTSYAVEKTEADSAKTTTIFARIEYDSLGRQWRKDEFKHEFGGVETGSNQGLNKETHTVSTYGYDFKGRLIYIAQEITSNDAKLKHEYKSTYRQFDLLGRIKSQIEVMNTQGELYYKITGADLVSQTSSQIVYEYTSGGETYRVTLYLDSDGSIKSASKCNSDNDCESISAEEIAQGELGQITSTANKDDATIVIPINFTSVTKTDFVYDEFNRMILKTDWISEDTSPGKKQMTRTSYIHDIHGRIKEQKIFEKSWGKADSGDLYSTNLKVIKMFYNRHDRMIMKIQSIKYGNYAYEDYSVTRYTYNDLGLLIHESKDWWRDGKARILSTEVYDATCDCWVNVDAGIEVIDEGKTSDGREWIKVVDPATGTVYTLTWSLDGNEVTIEWDGKSETFNVNGVQAWRWTDEQGKVTAISRFRLYHPDGTYRDVTVNSFLAVLIRADGAVDGELHQTNHQEISYAYNAFGQRIQTIADTTEDPAFQGLSRRETTNITYDGMGFQKSIETVTEFWGIDTRMERASADEAAKPVQYCIGTDSYCQNACPIACIRDPNLPHTNRTTTYKKDNILYNSLGQEVGYTEHTKDYDDANIEIITDRTVFGIKYNALGQIEEMLTVEDGTYTYTVEGCKGENDDGDCHGADDITISRDYKSFTKTSNYRYNRDGRQVGATTSAM